MAYYDALIAAWNNPTQPPSGVTGMGLTGLTTNNKLIAINAWTVTGSVPTNFPVTGAQIFDAINWPDFTALSAANQLIVWNIILTANGSPVIAGPGLTVSTAITTVWPLTQITGSISGNTLTVTAVSGPAIGVNTGNCIVAGTGVRIGTKITAQLTGTAGSTGTYTVNGAAQTIASQAMSTQTQTIANFIALAVAVVELWWQANAYLGPINHNDLVAAGNLT